MSCLAAARRVESENTNATSIAVTLPDGRIASVQLDESGACVYTLCAKADPAVDQEQSREGASGNKAPASDPPGAKRAREDSNTLAIATTSQLVDDSDGARGEGRTEVIEERRTNIAVMGTIAPHCRPAVAGMVLEQYLTESLLQRPGLFYYDRPFHSASTGAGAGAGASGGDGGDGAGTGDGSDGDDADDL